MILPRGFDTHAGSRHGPSHGREEFRRALPLVLGLALAGCGPAPEFAIEPQSLHFTPAHPELALRLVHRGAEPLPLSRIRLDHRDPDWSAFTIVDATLPRQIEPGGQVQIHLRVDVGHFARSRGSHEHRPGQATLTLHAGGQPRRIALHFADPGVPLGVWLARLGLLAALLAGLFALRRRVPWGIGLPAAIAVAIAPLGAGLCVPAPGPSLGPADLLQCAAGRGGAPLQMLPHSDGLGLLLAALLYTALGGISAATSEALRRRLALALALIAVVVAAGSLDPQALVQAQTGLRWGLWVQPFAAAALWIAASLEVSAASAHSRSAGVIAAIGLAALLTTVSFGGAELPPQWSASLPHAAAVALGLGLWLAKVAALGWLLVRLRLPRNAVYAVLPLVLAQIVLAVAVGPGAPPR